MLSIPPHCHDIHQKVEHAIGILKRELQELLNKYEDTLDNILHAQLQQMVYACAMRFTSKIWRDNVHRWVQCMRIIAAPEDQKIIVYKHRKRKGEKSVCEEERCGTNGSYCYPDFS